MTLGSRGPLRGGFPVGQAGSPGEACSPSLSPTRAGAQHLLPCATPFPPPTPVTRAQGDGGEPHPAAGLHPDPRLPSAPPSPRLRVLNPPQSDTKQVLPPRPPARGQEKPKPPALPLGPAECQQQIRLTRSQGLGEWGALPQVLPTFCLKGDRPLSPGARKATTVDRAHLLLAQRLREGKGPAQAHTASCPEPGPDPGLGPRCGLHRLPISQSPSLSCDFP